MEPGSVFGRASVAKQPAFEAFEFAFFIQIVFKMIFCCDSIFSGGKSNGRDILSQLLNEGHKVSG